MKKYVCVLTDRNHAGKLSHQPVHYNDLEVAKKQAEKFSRDLNTEVMVCEVVGTFRPTVTWASEQPEEVGA